MSAAPPSATRSLVARGIAWNGLFQVFTVILGFAVTMKLTRHLATADYGESGAVAGVLALLGAFSAHTLLGRALQLGPDEEPDWSLYWSAALWLQAGQALVCEALAGACWLLPVYRPLAPLLHLAGLGLLLEGPAQLATVMLRRSMDYRRLRILGAIAAVSSSAATLALGLAGHGAIALVLGANVLLAVPLVIDLLLVRRFRPARWLAPPDRVALRPAIAFGLQQGTGAMLWAARTSVPAVVLPAALGYGALGLLGRATGIYQSTAGRVVSVLLETVYPLLPRYARDRERYARHATLLLQVVAWIALPSVAFVALEGPTVSRVLYGQRWVAADPVLLPAAILTMGVLACAACASVLLAMDRLRTCLLLDVVGAALAIPTVLLALGGGSLGRYAWALAAAHVVGAGLSLAAAAPLLAPGWAWRVLLPPVTGALLAGGALVLARPQLDGLPVAVRLAVVVALFCGSWLLAVRLLHGRALAGLLAIVPGGARLGRLLHLPAASTSEDATSAPATSSPLRDQAKAPHD